MSEEVTQCLDGGDFMGHQAGFQEAVVDHYGDKKYPQYLLTKSLTC